MFLEESPKWQWSGLGVGTLRLVDLSYDGLARDALWPLSENSAALDGGTGGHH